MQEINVTLKNCYGIKSMDYTFDFSNGNQYAIYAPNGSMKTSFAKTFQDISENQESSDRIFTARQSERIVKDENDNEIPAEYVLVIEPYDRDFSHSEKTSTLLVNISLKKEYMMLNEELEICKKEFLNAMKAQSGSRMSLDKEISSTFTRGEDDESFYRALERVSNELKEQKDSRFDFVEYDCIFDEAVVKVLDDSDMKTAIQEYISRYNNLLESSTYFKRGVFEYYNATQIARILSKNGFFEAKHTVTLQADDRKEIKTQKQLEKVVQDELDTITRDSELRTKFDSIKKKLEKNEKLRKFHRYLCDHPLLLSSLGNIELFKEDIWKSYFKANEQVYDNLLSKYRKVRKRRDQIAKMARDEQTHWEDAIHLFNQRFVVPFTLEAKNKEAVMLGDEDILDLGYSYHDGTEETSVERSHLLESLSQGEKKALYILNVIFEIEVRRQSEQETLFVVDDIADSFDYKNKYAIIQYLQDISDNSPFKLIILTHNFDFFRTVNSRLVQYSRCLTATKTETETKLEQAEGIRNPFLRDWKNHFFDDGKKRIASISFIRNLLEYTVGSSNRDYCMLTSMLHWHENTESVKQKDLDAVFCRMYKCKGGFQNPEEPVFALIEREANNCITGNEEGRLEHKIVLSIAIRLLAEKFMWEKIGDPEFLRNVQGNRTGNLLKCYETDFSGDDRSIETLRTVLLMTPENIHLNAFMYEPIIDMSDESLKRLLINVRGLT